MPVGLTVLLVRALAEHGKRATALITRFALELPGSERTDR